MSDGDMGRWHDVDLSELTPDQRVRLDQSLRAEAIPATWGGTVLRVDEAYEARITTLVEEARAAAAPTFGGPPASGAPPIYGSPPGYGAPPVPGSPAQPVPYGYAPVVARKTNTSAVVSLVLGLIGVLTACVPTAPVGLWFGFKARREIRATGEDGDGVAIAGIVLSAIGTLFFALAVFFVVFVLVLGVVGSSSG